MTLPPLPEPSSHYGFQYFGISQMQNYGRACYLAALEEAAKVCDEQYPYSVHHSDQRAAKNCAAAIRALKEKP